MPRRVPLPSHLASGAFRVSEAAAVGLSEGRLRGPDLIAPHRGVRRLDAILGEPHLGLPLPTHVSDYVPLLRARERFSHTTAAEVWGAPLPFAHTGRLHLTTEDGSTRARGRGVLGHRGIVESTSRRGVPISTPDALLRELGTILPLDDLVAIADHLVHDPRVIDPHDIRPWIRLDELRTRLARPAGRGIRLAREAADLARSGAESPRETALRLLVQRAGLPEPVLAFELTDARGRRIGWFDLAWPEYRTIAEYDGDQHRTDSRQYDRDILRFDRATEAGHRVVRVRAAGLSVRARPETIRRIRAALRAGGWPG